MAWYHVNSCDCPIGCCDCGPISLPKVKTEEELNLENKYIYYAYNPRYLGEMIFGQNEKRKPSWHPSWKFIYVGKL